MNYLLDTHALIWYLDGDEGLSDKAKNCIDNKNASITPRDAEKRLFEVKTTNWDTL